MKLLIGERSYDMFEGVQKATMSDLILLKRATKSSDFPSGLSIVSIQKYFQSLPDDPDDQTGLLELILESDGGLEVMRALVFLARRRAGEQGTFEELTDVPLTEIGFSDDDDEDDVQDADPKVDGELPPK